MKVSTASTVIVAISVIIFTIIGNGCKTDTSTIKQESGYNRSETLYVGGGLWDAPINWNPMTPWSCTPGTIGLIYETLFVWNAQTDELSPWLAKSGEWIKSDVYELELRSGITWTDGKPLTVKDVKFTFDLAKKYELLPSHPMWEMLEEVEIVDDTTINFYFKDPRYHEWLMSLYQNPILPEHIWSKKQKEAIIEGENDNPVGSGPYLHHAYDQDKMVYLRNDKWWAIEQKSMSPKPKNIVMMKIFSNTVALGMVLKGDLDLSNFYLPGLPKLKSQYDGFLTWYDGAPYYTPNNTTYLFMNNRKKPFTDKKFREAIKYAINIDEIISVVFDHQAIAADPLGFLPIDTWMQYHDKSLASEYKHEFNLDKARQLLTEAGYINRDEDDRIEMPDGTNFNLKIICPQGWTDWQESVKVIAKNLSDIGLDVDASFPDYGKYWQDLSSEDGEYDMALNNFESVPNATVWNMLNWLTQEEGLQASAEDGNYSRYDNQEVRDLLDNFNRISLSNTRSGKKIISKVSRHLLEDTPFIPLWYGPSFYQASENHWTNWPTEDNPYARADTCAGQWQLGTIEVLCRIKPVDVGK